MKCLDARWSCPGYPSRLKFQDEGGKLRRKLGNINEITQQNPSRKAIIANRLTAEDYQLRQDSSSSKAKVATRYAPHLMPKIPIQSVPLSSNDILALHFSSTFNSYLPRGKSLAKFGVFIKEVPRHVGLNKACDFSLWAICNAHNALLTANEQSLYQSRAHYGRALLELRRLLTETKQGMSAETLCATMLLGIYEVCECNLFCEVTCR